MRTIFMFPGWSFLRQAAALPAAAALLAVAVQAEPRVVPIGEEDTVEVQAQGDTATLQLQLEGAPANSSDARLLVSNRDGYVFWSAPISRQNNQWTAQFGPEALEAMLMVDRLVAEFPGAAPNNEALQFTIPRDRLTEALEGTGSLVEGEPLFFTPPEAPEKPEVPGTDVNRQQAESFAVSALRWDRELAAHAHQFDAALSRAHAFFLDLRTAGRLPWSEETLQQLEQQYESLQQRVAELENERMNWRQQASAFVEQWNSAHSDQPPVQVRFTESAAS